MKKEKKNLEVENAVANWDGCMACMACFMSCMPSISIAGVVVLADAVE